MLIRLTRQLKAKSLRFTSDHGVENIANIDPFFDAKSRFAKSTVNTTAGNTVLTGNFGYNCQGRRFISRGIKFIIM